MELKLTGNPKTQSDLTCLWCGFRTTTDREQSSFELKYSNKEHVFPESIGGNQKLLAGDVCEECNNKLSFLDKSLKTNNSMMRFSLQGDHLIKGKKTTNKQRIERRKAERIEISDPTGKSIVRRDREKKKTEIINPAPEGYDLDFTRAIHKCIANAICFEKGTLFVSENYPELIDFVLNGTNPNDWSYAVSYQGYREMLSVTPQITDFAYREYSKDRSETIFVAFMHTSGIWLACSHPNAMDVILIEKMSKIILDDDGLHQTQFKKQFGYKIEDIFNSPVMSGSPRTLIGKINFLWIKKNMEGIPNPKDHFHLLTKCQVCGQINPTHINIPKSTIITKNQFNGKQYSKNSWNSYTKDDLIKKGFITEKWSEENWNNQLNVGISTPPGYDIKNLKITRIKIDCINCKNIIQFDAKDCFL